MSKQPAPIDSAAALNRPSHRPAPDFDKLDAIDHPAVSLDPGNITNIDGYNDETKGYVAAAHDAFKLAHESIGKVIAARQTVNKNTAWPTDKRILEVGRMADKLMPKVTKAFDNAHATLVKGIDSIEASLNKPLDGSGVSGGHEIREYVRNLPDDRRVAFMQERIAARDTKTLSAVLSMPAYLSGLKDEMVAAFTRNYHEQTQPQITARVRVMRTALERLEKSGGLVAGQFESAIGYKWRRFNAIAARAKAAQDALLTD